MILMEVCGTHTVSIFRHGIRELLPSSIRLLSGPGCPVCVTDQGDIDAALSLARRKNTLIATYGDMLRVPGSRTSLAEERSSGSDIRIITSASRCIDMAMEYPDREVIFFAVGIRNHSSCYSIPCAGSFPEGTAQSLGDQFSQKDPSSTGSPCHGPFSKDRRVHPARSCERDPRSRSLQFSG